MYNILRGPFVSNHPVLQQNGSWTELIYYPHIVANKQNSPSFLGNVLHPSHTFSLKFGISNCKHFIHNQNLGFKVGGYSESQTDLHPTGIPLCRSINKFLYTGKVNYFVKLAVNFSFFHSKNGPVEIYIFPACKFGMESSSNFQQARHPTSNFGASNCRLSYPGKYFQQSRFPCTISPNYTQNLPSFDFERDITQGPYYVGRITITVRVVRTISFHIVKPI